MLPTKNQIADRFATRLKEEIGEANYAEVVRINRTLQGACASHDYCDANMVMLESLKDFGVAEEDVLGDDGVQALWNASWNLWRERTR